VKGFVEATDGFGPLSAFFNVFILRHSMNFTCCMYTIKEDIHLIVSCRLMFGFISKVFEEGIYFMLII
jgi:hypothetical protein